MKKMPVLFVGHGSPMNVLDKENPFNQNFSLITQNFPKPKAILMISAHWYSSRLQVTSGEHPEMIYDFYGFPDELSQVQYPAPGSPELAKQVQSLLQPENVELNPTRGFDHGAWAVLKSTKSVRVMTGRLLSVKQSIRRLRHKMMKLWCIMTS